MRSYRHPLRSFLIARRAAGTPRTRPWLWLQLALVAALITGCASESTPERGPSGRPGGDGPDGARDGADAEPDDEPADADEDASARDAATGKPPNNHNDASDDDDDDEPDASESDEAQSDAGASVDAGDEDAEASDPGPRFPSVSDLSKDGPYGSTTLRGVGPGGGYTAYVPEELAPDGAKNPIVGWMSGGGTTHTSYPLLPRLATHGFFVMAADVTPGIGQEAMLGEQIIAGIAWAIAESEQSGSDFYGKLDSTKLASMGYSMGSLATFMIADDPRLTTTVHISGGNMAPERVQNLHAPAAFICGIPTPGCSSLLSSECDIAGANCATDFQNATTPVFYATFPSGHVGILTPPFSEAIGTLATTWLRWKLMDDASLAEQFLGPDCELCTDPDWKIERKNLE